ncbi:MAG: hypothetical protein ACI4KD_02340 [Oscillospiraceae bacterium]
MNNEEKVCPCQTVKDLEKQVDEQRSQLAKGETQFAVINTKLNLIMGVLGTVGASLVGIIIKLMMSA